MVTKDDLKAEFTISDETVCRTLEACGINPTQEGFSEEEIDTFFRPARRMITAEKKKYSHVKAWADSLRKNGAKRGETTDNIRTLLDDEMYAVTDRIVSDSIEKHIDEIPEMYERHMRRLLKDKSVQGAFLRWEERVLSEMERAPLTEDTTHFPQLPNSSDDGYIDTESREVHDNGAPP